MAIVELAQSASNIAMLPVDELVVDLSRSLNVDSRSDFVSYLPSELLTKIFSRVDVYSLGQCLLVNRSWNAAVNTNAVWRAQFRSRRRWRAIKSTPENTNWKKLFQTRYLLDRRWMRGEIQRMTLVGHNEGVYCVQFDDDKIVTGSRDRTIKVWSTLSGELLRTLPSEAPLGSDVNPESTSRGHDGSVLCLSYDDKILISGSSDATCIIWSLPDYIPTHRLVHHSSRVLDVCLSEHYIVTCSKDGTICILDRHAESYPVVRVVEACRGSVNAIHMQRNVIASAGVDRVVRLWNAETGKALTSFHGHTRGLACVQISSDLRIVVSGGNDNTIRVWDLQKRQCIKVFDSHHGLVRSLHLVGRRLISGSYDQTIKVWDLDRLTLVLDLDKFHESWILTAKSNCKRIVSTSFGPNPVALDFSIGLDPFYLKLLEA